MTEPACETCRFFLFRTMTRVEFDEVNDEEREETYVTSLCRRNPVSVPKSKEDWCGEYQEEGESALGDTNGLLREIFHLLTRNNIRKGIYE